MTETELLDLTIPVRTREDWILRVAAIEYRRRSSVLRGLTDSTPNEPWRICSPEEFKAGARRMLERAAKTIKDKDGEKRKETVRETAARIEAEQWKAGK